MSGKPRTQKKLSATRAKKKKTKPRKPPASEVANTDPLAHFSDKERAEIPQSPLEVAHNLRALAERLHRLSNASIVTATWNESKPERFRDPEMAEAGNWASFIHWKIRHAELIEAGLNSVPPNTARAVRALLHTLSEPLRRAVDNFAFNWHGYTPEERTKFKIAQAESLLLHKAVVSAALDVTRLRELAEQCEADEESLWISPTEAKKLWNGLITRQAANKAVNSAIEKQKLSARPDGKVLRTEVEKLVEKSKARQDDLLHID